MSSIYENIEPKAKVKKPKSKKRKIVISVICIVLALALVITGTVVIKNKKSAETNYAYIRTTTLAKGTLENSISTTGTVKSAETSNVTTSLSYTVKSILVSVGDSVKEGDTICTLDTSDLETQIEREQNNLNESLQAAQNSYDSASSNYNQQKSKLESSKTDLNDAKADKNSAYTPYKNAKNSISALTTSYNNALKKFNNAGAIYVKAQSDYNSALSNYKSGKINANTLTSYAKKYMSAVQDYYGGCGINSYSISADSSNSTQTMQSTQNDFNSSSNSSANAISVTKTANDICNDIAKEINSLCGKSITYSTGANTLLKLSNYANKLKQAKINCNYDSLESAYTSAKATYETAKSNYEQCENSFEQAKEQLSQAKSQLSSASSSDTLDELKTQLTQCTITANQSGTITSLNATIGSSAGGSNMGASGSSAIATISNLDKLKISITIPEANINDATIGMTCYITSDASSETINGTLTQIDPIANDSNTFGAEVTVNDENTSLKIGMNASVELLVSSKDDVYQVPIDAIGNDDNGDFVYRKTSGEGTDMQFEKVYVEKGEQNDYYIEISSSDLAEGDVIRSTSNLEEGIETGKTTDKTNSNNFSLFGNMQGNGKGDMGGENMHNNSNSNMPTPPNNNNFSGGGPNG